MPTRQALPIRPLAAAILLAALPHVARAQGRMPDTDAASGPAGAASRHVVPVSPTRADSTPPLLTSRERWTTAGFVAATLFILPLDHRLAREFERPSAHRDPWVSRVAGVMRWAGDPGAIIFTTGSYAVGRLGRHRGLADAGLHATEAVLLSGALTNVLKLGVGRARPYAVGGRDPFVFRPGRAGGAYASFPSGHTTVAFAASSAASAELGRSEYADLHPRIAGTTSVLLFGAASLVGASRMYHDAHWASDVVAAAAIGSVAGHALVRVQHARRAKGRLDRLLLGADGAVQLTVHW